MATVKKSSSDLEDQVKQYDKEVRTIQFAQKKSLEVRKHEIHRTIWIGALAGTIILIFIFPIGTLLGAGIGYLIGVEKIKSPFKKRMFRLHEKYPSIKAVRKGMAGEMSVTEHITKNLSDDYLLINDLTISTANGRGTQIDHILFGKSTVYAIETKNITGRFYPYSKHKWLWYPIVSRGKVKKKTYVDSPAAQSQYHATQLRRLLKSKGHTSIKVTPVVILTNAQSVWHGRFNQECPVFSNPKAFIDYILEADIGPGLEDTEEVVDGLLEFQDEKEESYA
ncbi:nuclease-related domain-containing protein [Alteribacter keqinensis]|uniref:NERD domain-containing protein n=1 Tax=Alteribacter keqinensis TaxID=2483800 RepID=A0A3M7TQC3_9BACI|nr:nuclease-related domain-containing protein [Alteribacter keqinensis]RNA67611.1 hypothetical protein EBO34_12870 [Alteribacter keqinensis]